MELQSNHRMPLVTREGMTALVCFNEREIQRQEEGTEQVTILYAYDYVRVSYPFTYASLVSALVKSRYDDDAMQAIVNNHLAENESDEHAAQFAAMQAWREEVKTVAHQAVEAE